MEKILKDVSDSQTRSTCKCHHDSHVVVINMIKVSKVDGKQKAHGWKIGRDDL